MRDARAEIELRIPRNWRDWAGPPEDAAVTAAGRDAFDWAVGVVEGFYGDDWFAASVEGPDSPTMNPWAWPLSQPNAVVRLLERAARIAVLPVCAGEALRDVASTSLGREFTHLEVVLEVAGLAARDGWTVTPEPVLQSGRKPDLVLDKFGRRFTVEVTVQGYGRRMMALQEFGDTVRTATMSVELKFGVDTETAAREAVADAAIDAWRDALVAAAEAVATQGAERVVDVHGIRTVIYPTGRRKSRTIYDGPRLVVDAWPRFAERLRGKADQTKGAGPTWLRIDELGGLIGHTQAVHWPPQQQLTALAHNLRAILEEFAHVRGVVVTHGAGPNYAGAEPEFALRAEDAASSISGCVVIERRLPGQRRRRTHFIPLEGGKRVALPASAELGLDAWYAAEGTWLDWALLELNLPPYRRVVAR